MRSRAELESRYRSDQKYIKGLLHNLDDWTKWERTFRITFDVKIKDWQVQSVHFVEQKNIRNFKKSAGKDRMESK